MGLDDWRRWLDVNARDGAGGAIAMEVTTAGRLAITTLPADGPHSTAGARVELDYYDAGLLLDQLREGMGVILARSGDPVAAAAVAGARAARDTPGEVGA